MDENITDVLVGKYGFRNANTSDSLSKRMKDISHTRYIGEDSYLHWFSKNSRFYIGEEYKAWTDMGVENIIGIPKDIKNADAAREIVNALCK